MSNSPGTFSPYHGVPAVGSGAPATFQSGVDPEFREPASVAPTSLTINEIGAMLAAMWAEPNCPPILLIGPPGGGKTTIINETAAACSLPCETLMGNSLEPSDVVGIPSLRDDVMKMFPPDWALELAGKDAVINFDEINTARPATLAALLRVILERRVGRLALGTQVRIVATMNPAEEAAHGWELPPAVANRFLHFSVAPTSVDEWKSWAARRVDELPEFYHLAETFPLASLYSDPTCGPFASPRSWYFALKAAARMIHAGKPHLVRTVVAAAVSPGLALSWDDARKPMPTGNWSQLDGGQVKLILERQIADIKGGSPAAVDVFWHTVLDASNHHAALVYVLLGQHREVLSKNTTALGQKAMRAVQDGIK